jgi:tetratricopeptide (TPR) repeat protein
VDAIVEGTVRRSGDQVRITANLLNARTDRHIWAESYERETRDVLPLQSELALAIAQQVQAKLTPQEQARLASTRPVNPEAHELYLKGSDWMARGDSRKALSYFQQAIGKEPNFARAYLGMAWAYGDLGRSIQIPAVQAFGEEKSLAHRALELDERLDAAHVALAYALWQGEWDWAGAENELRRAFEINPHSQEAHLCNSWYLSLLGRSGEAIEAARRLLEINPMWPDSYYTLGSAYYYARRYDEALEQFKKLKSSTPGRRWMIPLSLGWAYSGKGLYTEAFMEFSHIPPGVLRSGLLGITCARLGRRAEAREFAQELTHRAAKEPIGEYDLALVYAALGERDRAFQALDEAYKIHDKGLCFIKVDPNADPLRPDPRFQALLRKMSFPP